MKPRNKLIRGYDKLSYTGQLIAEAKYMEKRIEAREEWSKIHYLEIIANREWYYSKLDRSNDIRLQMNI